MQRAERIAAQHRSFGNTRSLAGAVGIQVDKRVQRGFMLCDSRQSRINEIDR